MNRASSLLLAAAMSVAAVAPALGQPVPPAEPPAAADPAKPSPIVQPHPSAVGRKPPKQTKKMGHAGKKMSRHRHAKAGRMGIPAGNAGSSGGPAAPSQ